MNLQIKRNDSKGVEVTSDDGLGLVVLCQQTSHNDHEKIKRDLENSLDLISSVDIFYAWSNASIFIFDVSDFSEQTRKDISDTLPKIKHAVIYNGSQSKGNSVNEMYISCNKHEIKIGKKFYTLFTMKEGE